MSKLHDTSVGNNGCMSEIPVPEHVQLNMLEIAGVAKEGLRAISVSTGLAVMSEMMAHEVEAVCGVKGQHDPSRRANRHGSTQGEVELGGRRLPVERPRVRSAKNSGEIRLKTYSALTSDDLLSKLALERMLAGVSTRNYQRTQEPVGDEVEKTSRSTSRSSISRRFIKLTRKALDELMSRRLDEIELAALMIDGIELAGRSHVVALGITTDGVKVPLGLWEGSTENAQVATSLLADLQDRGLSYNTRILCVLGGAKALAKAVREVMGPDTPVQRCVRHKERNVLDHLPEHEKSYVQTKLRKEWAKGDHESALEGLRSYASRLERVNPSAAASLKRRA